ncbi:MAG: DNA adenine methylase [Acetobacteraceae bacterium]|nr:DNA adenine methylase [Acetobacteraceae bacterium]
MIHFTPLRYPGGKGKLAAYVKRIITTNRIYDGEYIEPFAGGAAIAMELLFHEYVARVRINDLSRPVFAFWHSVLNQTDALCRLIRDTPRTVEAWDLQKLVLGNDSAHDLLEVGFATFFLNRTNRSGILNGGIIGGRDQTGPWKIDARYNADELIFRIESIARLKSRISLTSMDALEFLTAGSANWPSNALIYCDPPYYVKGKDLYYHYYNHENHEQIATCIRDNLAKHRWIVSYDNVQPIRDIYSGCQRVIYGIGYSARGTRQGSEVMFFSESLDVPPLIGAVMPIEQIPRLL